MAIESWNETVPQKSTRANGLSDEQDPAIQAYLEAKLSLFRRAGATGSSLSRSQTTSSVGSAQS